MSGFMDRQCRCGKRYGWAGGPESAPACPRCGVKPDPADLSELQSALDEMERVILARKASRGGTMSKADYVRGQGQTRDHTCHWPGCKRQVHPAMFMCKGHWYRLPKALRDRIWATYRLGQEIDMNPIEEYLEAAHATQVWIREHGGPV